jgi:hypothetical protein
MSVCTGNDAADEEAGGGTHCKKVAMLAYDFFMQYWMRSIEIYEYGL